MSDLIPLAQSLGYSVPPSFNGITLYSSDPVEGVDYIVDYYAILDIERSADLNTIKCAYRKKAPDYHTDQYRGDASDITGTMRREYDLVNKAYEVLKDAELRGNYDNLLASFPDELVSKSGIPILSLNTNKLKLNELLNESADKNLENELQEALRQSGYSEAMFAGAREAYKALPDNEAIRSAYRLALSQKINFLGVKEFVLWRAAGFTDQPTPKSISDPSEYLTEVLGKICEAKELIYGLTRSTLLCLEGDTSNYLLLPGELAEKLEEDAEVTVSRAAEKATSSFERYEEHLATCAQELSAAIDEYLSLAPKKMLCKGTYRESLNIVVVMHGKAAATLGFIFDGEGIVSEPVSERVSALIGLSKADLDKETGLSVASHVLYLEVDNVVDFQLQICECARIYFETVLTEQ